MNMKEQSFEHWFEIQTSVMHEIVRTTERATAIKIENDTWGQRRERFLNLIRQERQTFLWRSCYQGHNSLSTLYCFLLISKNFSLWSGGWEILNNIEKENKRFEAYCFLGNLNFSVDQLFE